jgi:hypothetical protein
LGSARAAPTGATATAIASADSHVGEVRIPAFVQGLSQPIRQQVVASRAHRVRLCRSVALASAQLAAA